MYDVECCGLLFYNYPSWEAAVRWAVRLSQIFASEPVPYVEIRPRGKKLPTVPPVRMT